MANKLFRITEQDVHVIMENVVRRVLKEYYDQKNLQQLWVEAIDILGAQTFVEILDDNYNMGNIYDKLIEKTGMDEEELDAIPYDEMADLMLHNLDPDTQYDILSFLSQETGAFEVDDITDAPTNTEITIDSFDDMFDSDGEVASEDEVETEEDEEEFEDPEFAGMDDDDED